MSNYYYLQGLTGRNLRELHDEVRKEMKSRGMLIYDMETQSYITKPKNKPLKKGSLKRANRKFDFIVECRNNDNIGRYKQRTKGNPSNSILIDFLCEDWRFLFPNANDKERRYYVYYHSDPTCDVLPYGQSDSSRLKMSVRFKGKPFYIGKGTGDRYRNMSGRSTSHISRVKSYLEAGFCNDDVFHICEDNLTEMEALELESKLITFFGCESEITIGKRYFNGFNKGILINSDIGKRPDWIDSIVKERFKG